MAIPLAELAGVLGGNIGKAGADIGMKKEPGAFTRLFTDPLFLSLLSGTATALHPGTAPINALVQKALGGQAMGKASNEKGNAFNDLIGQVLSGNVPDNVEVKISGDKGLSLTAKPKVKSDAGGVGPTDNIQDVINTINTGAGQGAPTPKVNVPPTNTQNNTLGRIYNPFGSGLSGLSASDLAVLGPEGVAQALSLDLNRDALLARTYNDLIEASQQERQMNINEAYYNTLGEHYRTSDVISGVNAETSRINAARQLIDSINKDDRPAMIKEYEYAVAQGYKGSLPDWKILAGDPNSYKEYERAVEGGYTGSYTDFLLKYRQAGTTVNVGERAYETAAGRGQAQPRVDIHNKKDLDEIIMNDPVLSQYKSFPPETPEEKRKYNQAKEEAVVTQIYSAVGLEGGEVIGVPKFEGSSIIFRIRWSNGDEETFTYVNK